VYEICLHLTKKVLTTCLWIFFVFVNAYGQSQRIDSLKAVLPSVTGAEQYEVYINLVKEAFRAGEFEHALQYNASAAEIAYSLGDSLRIVRCGRNDGVIYNRWGRPKEAMIGLGKVVAIAKRNSFSADYQDILNSLGNAYLYQGQYDQALKAHFENLQFRERERNLVGTYQSRNNIGMVYFKLKNFEKAIEFYESALTISEGNTFANLETLYINIGLCLNQLGNFDEAERNFNKGFSICGENCSNQILMEGRFGLGVSNYHLDDYEKSREFFAESLEQSRVLENQRFFVENLLFLGRLDFVENKIDSAVKKLDTVERIASEQSFMEILIETYKVYLEIYKTTSNFEKASFYQSKYIHVKDSVYNEKLIENLAKIQTDYAERENIKTIATKDVQIEQQRDLSVLVAIIAILAGLLILVLQRSNRVSKRVNAQLSEAKETIQQQNKLLEIKNKDLDREVEKKTIDLERVNLSLKQVNDELDNFIYKTSHDIRGPLASLKGMCNVALMDVKDPVALDYLRKLDSTAERLNSILTRLLIINQINNSKLMVAHIDFAKTIDDILKLENKKGIPSKLAIRKNIATGPEMSILSDKELVRIVLENLIDNAIKFFNESEDVESFVEIVIAPMENGDVRARVIDNGIGISESNPGKLFQMFFRASERSEIGGIGLYIVKTATTKVGGKVGLLTTPEGYTEFNVIFPKNPPTADDYPSATYKK
jgi:signal transduction histidine kinase